MDNFTELRLRAQLERVITEREGMKAKNAQYAQRNEPIPYGEEEFQNLCNEFAGIEEQIRSSG